MSASEIELLFPDLRTAGYRVTSPATPSYNCFAWAGEDTRNWWQPLELHGYFWPAEIPAELTLESLAAVYQGLGYSACDSAEFELGFEKIAIYAEPDGTPTHAARQISSGAWTSKLGELEDIEHLTLASLETFYGKVRKILRRSRAG